MTGQGESLDMGVFVRTAGLFQEKRKALAASSVQDLARDIVRRVSNMKHVAKDAPAAFVAEESVAGFCDVLMEASSTAALEFIRARQAEGASHQVILYGYLAEGARLLGDRWEADEISFLDVIHGTGHLYALLRAVQTTSESRRFEGSSGRQALFAVVPGETHAFGARLAAETFRDAGWSIDLEVGAGHDALVDHVQRTEPNIIGLSLSTEDRLPDLIRLVVALRLVRPASIIGVAPALNMADGAIRSVADVDVIFRDARSAVRDLEWMLQMRS